MIIFMVCKGKLKGKYIIQSTLKNYMKQQETVFLKYAFTNHYNNVHVSAVNYGNISHADVLQ